jgi:subtilisin family serine protease
MSTSFANLGFQNLWQETLGDPEICIAILDGPVDHFHASFIEASITFLDDHPAQRSSNSTTLRHGTHITSIIFGQHHSLVKGIAPHCRGIVIPIFQAESENETAKISCSQTDLAQAIDQAVIAGAHVINISAGEFSPLGIAEPVLTDAVQRCTAAGVLIVAAAGNQGCECLQVPGALPSVLAVGAMDAYGNPMDYSNWGDTYQLQGILAPGECILGASPSNGVALGSGTSYATAIVSGVSALLLSLQRKTGQIADPLRVRQILLDSALKTEDDSRRSLAGRLNLTGAAALTLQSVPLQHNSELKRASTPFHGDYIPQSWALRKKYRDVPLEKFGTVDIYLPSGSVYNVRDLHYTIGSTSGMRLIPVSDEGDIVLQDGTVVAGYDLIDDGVRVKRPNLCAH